MFPTSLNTGVPNKQEDEDKYGYNIFRQICKNVILFTGTYRFLDNDLPALLDIMRTPGGRVVPTWLRDKVLARVVIGTKDPRLQMNYVAEGVYGFFALGARVAIYWDIVARMMHSHVDSWARVSTGPKALCNTSEGKPDYVQKPATQQAGQLVYCFQAADRFKHPQADGTYWEALRFVKLSETGGLLGICPVFVGMRIRLTQRVLRPELVQEATGEVLGIHFHPMERFGHPASSSTQPAATHDCWQCGWVVCDYLPIHIEIRFDGCTEDYTGDGRPGVYLLKPTKNDWTLPVERTATIDHPGALRPKVVKFTGKRAQLAVTRYQLPIAPEDVMTFQNAQGKTIRGPEGEPKGLVANLFKLPSMSRENYLQHLYMILGRAQKLEWVLLENFPYTDDGMPDWGLFEQGPPSYMCELMEVLEKRAKATRPRLLQAVRELGVPAWATLRQKPRKPDPDCKGRFLHDPSDWGFQRRGNMIEIETNTTLEQSTTSSTATASLTMPRACINTKERDNSHLAAPRTLAK
jgi:hypothetical protein